MGSHGESTKRPICPKCTKPLKLCLCCRFSSPPLDNSIHVTVLQHDHEIKHPLNSTRVAKLGFKNLSVVHVSDVNLHAQLVIRPLNPEISDSVPALLGIPQFNGEITENGKAELGNSKENPNPCYDGDDLNNCIMKDMNKYKVKCSNAELNITLERNARPNLDWVLGTQLGQKLISNGFRVKRLHTKKKNNSTEIYQIEEYDIMIPANSALLFPNEKSIGINSIDFEVKSLIVLDGTWAKAQRMYHENPWLKLLPHLKLNLKIESLYKEVRHEPKSGCLSTIESIIFAMKELGDELEGLDSILGVFESMILDQRRCKDERVCVSSQN